MRFPIVTLSHLLQELKISVFAFIHWGTTFLKHEIALIIDWCPEGEWLKTLEFIFSPIGLLVENGSMVVASWWDESLIISQENEWKGFLIRTRPNPCTENLYIVMDGVCISLVTADRIIIWWRGADCGKLSEWLGNKKPWRKEKPTEGSERGFGGGPLRLYRLR